MSYPPSAGGQPPSFKTNVNRAKTKRWVEAKSYSYDGDDWGEADEYDEYGGYDEPPPPPKPTGLRQQGQSARSVPQSPYGSPTDPYQRPMDNSRQGYGNMGGPQQYGQRSATNPQPRVDTEHARSNSFDRGDEKRSFSAGGFQPGMASPGIVTRQQPSYTQDQHQGPANSQPPMQFDPNQMRPVQPEVRRPYPEQQIRQHAEQPIQETEHFYDPRSHHGEPSYPDEPQYPSMGSRAQSMTSNTSSMDIHNRRDFTPSALPPPLHTRGSPSPDSRSSSTHPPRKSSLSQTNQPTILAPSQSSSMPAPPEPGAAQRQRTSSGADKPLPFVRPADIYRRMQEEKEKDRQSQDSSRPSMDAITGRPEQVERDTGPAFKEEAPDLFSPALSPTPSHVLDSVEAREHGPTLQPMLDPVAERRSEYGTDGIGVDHEPPNSQKQSAGPWGQEKAPIQPHIAPRSAQETLSPVLPEVARMSSFGDSFLGSNGATEGPSLQAMLSATNTTTPLANRKPTGDESPGGLQHQPSAGFRSVVNQAFDVTDDQIPPTPTSTVGSGIERSTSGGTSVISPIISRGPSTATPNANVRYAGARPRTPSLPEESEDISSRPMSSSSIGTPRQTARKPSPSQVMSSELGEPSPPTFIPGHRRDLSTPSPSNSPARTPALEANNQLRQPQEAELAMSTPTEPSFLPGAFRADQALRKDSDASSIRSLNDPRKRSESPSKSRVRDLAGKFESASSSRRGSDQSLSQRGGTGTTSPQRLDMPAPGRPLAADRKESFRPHLPGGWDSYISNAPPARSSSKDFDDEDASPLRQTFGPSHSGHTNSETLQDRSVPDLSGMPEQSNDPSLRQDGASSTPFSPVAAAGTALAGANTAVTGIKDGPEHATFLPTSSTKLGLENQSSLDPPRTPRDASTATHGVIHQITSGPSIPIAADHNEASDVAPTPPLKDMQMPERAKQAPDHFQPSSAFGAAEPRSEQATPLARPPTLSALSTDTGSQYESDRLRREIVRSLTPNAPSEPTTAESDSPYQDEPQGPGKANVQRAHESMVIPREYDSYWNDSESVDLTRSSSKRISEVTPSAIEQHPGMTTDGDQKAPSTNHVLSPRLQRLVSEPRIEDQRPNVPPHRFSWEQASTKEEPIQGVQQGTEPVDLEKRYLESRSADSPTLRQSFDKDGTGPRDANVAGASGDLRDRPPTYPGDLEAVEHLSDKRYIEDSSEGQDYGDEPRAFGASSVADRSKVVEPIPASPQIDSPNTFGQGGSLPLFPPPQTAQPKIPAFREILALKTPAERIRGYNEAREQFANQDTGLAHWLAVTATELPEHADVLSSVGRRPAAIMSHKPSSSRLLSGLRSTGPRSDVSETAGPSFGQSSFPSSGSSKLATQQVQAKGKDLLHSAGVFGGKANVAAKGLFSKGRSKFRGAGGTDKVDK